MRHRGPDDSGMLEDGELIMGMSCLAILDLSPLGHQPMRSHCGRYYIVYNGECYNYKTIRSALESTGDTFTSNTDTEVVLQAFVHWGTQCLTKLNGMFAFAIWDTKEQSLFAGRDHMGIKPFYYSEDRGEFIFGSEVKTMIRGGVSDEIDHEAVFEYFTFGYIQQPLTILKKVKALLPGHFLIYKDKKISIQKYWQISVTHSSLTFDQAALELEQRLRQAVRHQLVSDKPLGLFLSGGLDSGCVLAAMQMNNVSTKTFSIGFEENDFTKNETEDAMSLSRHFGTDHTSITLQTDEVVNALPAYFNSLDQPSVDGLNTFLVSKYASKEMTVALSGLGGDELFAGYSRHALLLWKSQHQYLQWLSRLIPLSVAVQLPMGLAQWFWKIRAYGESSNFLLNYTISRTLTFPSYRGLLKINSTGNRDFNILDQYTKVLQANGRYSKSEGTLDKILKMEAYTFMSSNLLRDMDATSMASSLEVRFPLLDKNIVEFAFSLPDYYKLVPTTDKRPRGEGTESYRETGAKKVLLRAMEGYLPDGFAEKRKNGFKLPVNYWLRKMERSKLREFIFDQRKIWEPFCKESEVEMMYESYLKRNDNNPAFWKFVSFIGAMGALKNAAANDTASI